MTTSFADERATWLEKAATLSEALPFLCRHAGDTFVVKFGGHAMGDDTLAELFARDIVLLRKVGINIVVVHGGGPQIGAMQERLQIKSTFVNGLRVTDRATVDVAEMVLAGSINKQVVTSINQAGGFALGLSGKDGRLIQARKVRGTSRDPQSGAETEVDLGYVGEPDAVNPHILDVLVRSDIIPVVAPTSAGPDGETYNVNADTAAAAVAGALNAARLLYLTDVAGVLDKQGDLIPELTEGQARALIADGTIGGGMIPKVENCLAAVDQGVEAAVILDGRVPHALLLELFTPAGAGTLVRRDPRG